MISLLKYEDGVIEVSPEVTLHKQFADILDSDSSVSKVAAKRDFMFIFLVKDPRSTLSVYPYSTRVSKAMDMVYGKEIKIGKRLSQAIEYYEQLMLSSSPTYVFWEAAKKALMNLTSIMRSADWGEDATFSIKEFASYIKEAEGMSANLQSLERKVHEEITAPPKLKAKQTINHFEQ